MNPENPSSGGIKGLPDHNGEQEAADAGKVTEAQQTANADVQRQITKLKEKAAKDQNKGTPDLVKALRDLF